MIACGVWSPLLARMAGAHIPLTPMVHQMIDVGPVPRFEGTSKAIEYPIVRDMDVFMYERQDGTGLEIGSYAHRSIHHDPEEIPSIEAAAALADRVPVHAGRLRPADAGRARPDAGDRRRRVGRREVRDQRPLLADARRDADPRRDARGEGPLVGGRGLGEGRAGRRQVGRRVDGARRVAHRPPLLGRRAASTRTRRRARTSRRAPARRSRRRTGSSTRPSSGRPTATCGSRRCTRRRRRSARSSTRSPAGSARSGTRRTRRSSSGTASSRAQAEWDARWWSPIINAEHLAMREHAGLFDLSAFAIFDVQGPGALDALQRRRPRADGRRRRPRRLHARCSARAAASSPT